MKRIFAVGLLSALTRLSTWAAPQTLTGQISDSMCGKSHTGMGEMGKNATECTLGCVKAGGKYVLFDTATMTIYLLDDQQKPAQFAGKKVKVTGTYDKATETIHVTDIKAAS